jgi:hypothetical protein
MLFGLLLRALIAFQCAASPGLASEVRLRLLRTGVMTGLNSSDGARS